MQVCKYANRQIGKYANRQIGKYANRQYQYSVFNNGPKTRCTYKSSGPTKIWKHSGDLLFFFFWKTENSLWLLYPGLFSVTPVQKTPRKTNSFELLAIVLFFSFFFKHCYSVQSNTYSVLCSLYSVLSLSTQYSITVQNNQNRAVTARNRAMRVRFVFDRISCSSCLITTQL
jgi:hypothetical protein